MGNTQLVYNPLARQLDYIRTITVGDMVLQGDFDASGGVLPPDVTKGWYWMVTVAGVIGTLDMRVGDSLIAKSTVVGATAATDFFVVDNTEDISVYDATLDPGDTIPSGYKTVRVQGNAAPVTMTSTPTLAAGGNDNQEIFIEGVSDTNKVTLQDGIQLTGSTLQMERGVDCELGDGDFIAFRWNHSKTLWREFTRSDN